MKLSDDDYYRTGQFRSLEGPQHTPRRYPAVPGYLKGWFGPRRFGYILVMRDETTWRVIRPWALTGPTDWSKEQTIKNIVIIIPGWEEEINSW